MNESLLERAARVLEEARTYLRDKLGRFAKGTMPGPAAIAAMQRSKAKAGGVGGIKPTVSKSAKPNSWRDKLSAMKTKVSGMVNKGLEAAAAKAKASGAPVGKIAAKGPAKKTKKVAAKPSLVNKGLEAAAKKAKTTGPIGIKPTVSKSAKPNSWRDKLAAMRSRKNESVETAPIVEKACCENCAEGKKPCCGKKTKQMMKEQARDEARARLTRKGVLG